MANYQNLKAAISAAIRTNGNQEITGQVLQDVLNSIVSVIGANYTFAGVATPATNPGTPDQNVMYLAMEGGTYTNFNGTVLPAGISLLMWNGSWTSETVMYGDGGVFDISVYKSSGGTLATFADLAAALNGGNNIPVGARKGGMSVKFVQSSDNKYVQYRLMADTWSVDTEDWQGVDDEPRQNSKNITESNGIYKQEEKICHFYYNNAENILPIKGIIQSSGAWAWNQDLYYSIFIRVNAGDKVDIVAGDSSIYFAFLDSTEFPNHGETVGVVGQVLGLQANASGTYTVPNEAVCLTIPMITNGVNVLPIKIAINDYDLSKTLIENINSVKQSVKDVKTSVYSFPDTKISSIEKYKGTINSSGKWVGVNSNYNHFILPCKEGDNVVIQNGTGNALYFAFLQSYSYNVKEDENVDIAGTLQGITANNKKTVTAPSGTRYIAYPTLYNNNDVSPTIFSINGYDYVLSLQSKFDELDNIAKSTDIKVDNALISYGTIKLTNIPTYNGGISSAGKWNTLAASYKFSYIPINGGDILKVKGRAGASFLAAFMNSYQVPVLDENVDKNGDYIQVAADTLRTYTAPTGTVCLLLLRLVNNADATPVSLSINDFDYTYSLEEKLERSSELTTVVHNITVDVNGSGDYTSLRDCFYAIGNILNMASSSRPAGQPEWVDTPNKTNEVFNVYIKPGTYDVRSYYTNEEWADTDTLGLIVPRGVNLIGIGKTKDDVILTCTSETASSRISLLNIQNDVTIENLTLSGNNLRYVVHDDYSYYPYSNAYGDIRKVKNVKLIGEHLQYNSIWGAGTKGGANWKFENCEFINVDGTCGFSVHDRNDATTQTKGEKFELINCIFQGIEQNNYSDIRFMPLYGACDEIVNIEGCIFNSLGIDTVGVDSPTTIYTIRGFGNNKSYQFKYDSAHGTLSVPKFSDECKLGLNSGTDNIVFNDYVLINGNSIEKGTSSDYDALALEDIEVGEYGIVRFKNSI